MTKTGNTIWSKQLKQNQKTLRFLLTNIVSGMRCYMFEHNLFSLIENKSFVDYNCKKHASLNDKSGVSIRYLFRFGCSFYFNTSLKLLIFSASQYRYWAIVIFNLYSLSFFLRYRLRGENCFHITVFPLYSLSTRVGFLSFACPTKFAIIYMTDTVVDPRIRSIAARSFRRFINHTFTKLKSTEFGVFFLYTKCFSNVYKC